jgi:hypothetical protein
LKHATETIDSSRKRHSIGSRSHTASTIRALERKVIANFRYSRHQEYDHGYDDERADLEKGDIAADHASLLPVDGDYERPASFRDINAMNSASPGGDRSGSRTSSKAALIEAKAIDDEEDDDLPLIFSSTWS